MKPVPSVARNILANFAGRGWAGIISLVFVPLYLKFLGIESYGLIGIYMSLAALLAILDMGLSATFNRELARLSALPDTDQEARDLTRTLEVVYAAVGLVAGLALVLAAPVISRSWVNAKGLPADVVTKAVMLMGGVVALEWPSAIYGGGLIGLQRQVLYNGIRAGMATVQAGGAVLILWLVSPTILAYFCWQMLTAFVQMLLFYRALWASLPRTNVPATFQRNLLQKNWRFAAGLTGISILGTALTQFDKIVLSKLLSLESFGYYVLAFNIASALNNIVHPIFFAIFPRLSQIVAQNNVSELRSLYHRSCQLLSSMLFPVAATLLFFSHEILDLWIGNPTTSNNTFLLLSIIIVGTSLNSILVPPFMLQLAHGWTSLSFYKNVVAIIVYLPVLLFLAWRHGAVGAGVAWIILNAGYVIIEIPIMHRRVLPSNMKTWYLVDILPPLLSSALICYLSHLYLPPLLPKLLLFAWILATAFVAFAAMPFMLPYVKDWIKRYIFRKILPT